MREDDEFRRCWGVPLPFSRHRRRFRRCLGVLLPFLHRIPLEISDLLSTRSIQPFGRDPRLLTEVHGLDPRRSTHPYSRHRRLLAGEVIRVLPRVEDGLLAATMTNVLFWTRRQQACARNSSAKFQNSAAVGYK